MFAYNAYGLRQAVTNAKGDVTRTEFDALNRVRSTQGPQLAVTRFEYDSLFLRAVVDAKQQRYEYGVNALGWEEWARDPRGQTTSHGYDAAGNETSTTNRRGQTISFTYDALGRLTSRTADGATTVYRPDPLGRWSVASNAASTDSVVIDAAGRVTEEWTRRAGGPTVKVASAYDAQNRRTQITVGGWAVGYHYDPMGQLDTIIDVSGRRTTLGYDNDGEGRRLSLPNGVTVTTGLTGLHTRTVLSYSVPSIDTAIGVGYRSDALGRLSTRLSADGSTWREYGYDRAGRLKDYTDYATTPGGA